MEILFEQRMGHIKMRVESLLKDDTLSPTDKVNMLIDDHIESVMHRQKFYKIVFCEQILNKNPLVINIVNEFKKKNFVFFFELI